MFYCKKSIYLKIIKLQTLVFHILLLKINCYFLKSINNENNIKIAKGNQEKEKRVVNAKWRPP